MYGANASGKSNFVKSIALLTEIVSTGVVAKNFQKNKSKTSAVENEKNSAQEFFIEFLVDKVAYCYQIKILGERISEEVLSYSGLGKNSDDIIFERNTLESGKTTIRFTGEKEFSEHSKILKKVVEENLIQPNKSLIKILVDIKNNNLFPNALSIFRWFNSILHILYPSSMPSAMAVILENNKEFKRFVGEIIQKLGLGISRIETEEIPLDDFLKEGNILPNLEELLGKSQKNNKKILGARSQAGAEVLIFRKKEKLLVKRIKLFHSFREIEPGLPFSMDEESDGTVRLFNFLPAIFYAIKKNGVSVIDEIERSIHPVLIKRLIHLISKSGQIGGQLIFTTHEANLLDQEIFRPDEIWFAEKDPDGNTSLFSLSDFKEHHTLDIRKGYLSGRYGAIPYLGELNLL